MYKNILISLLSMSCFFILLWGSATAGNKDLVETTDRFNQSMELSGRFFKVIYDKFGRGMRISAIFDACDKKGLSKAFEPNIDEMREVIVGEFVSLKATTKLKFSDDRALFDSLLSTLMYIQGYKVGIKEAVRIFKTQNVCEVFEMKADELLLEKKQLNKKEEQ